MGGFDSAESYLIAVFALCGLCFYVAGRLHGWISYRLGLGIGFRDGYKAGREDRYAEFYRDAQRNNKMTRTWPLPKVDRNVGRHHHKV